MTVEFYSPPDRGAAFSTRGAGLIAVKFPQARKAIRIGSHKKPSGPDRDALRNDAAQTARPWRVDRVVGIARAARFATIASWSGRYGLAKGAKSPLVWPGSRLASHRASEAR
jgi:hypothetical protein